MTGTAQNFAVKFTATDEKSSKPVKGALAWIYQSDGKTIKQIVESNEQGIADFGAQPASFGFGYTDKPLTNKYSLAITTIQNLPNNGIYQADDWISSCSEHVAIKINVANIPSDVDSLELDDIGVERSVMLNKNAHTAVIDAEICRDIYTKAGISEIPIVGKKAINEDITQTQSSFYFAKLNIASIVKDQVYNVSMDQVSSPIFWKINGFAPTDETWYWATASYDIVEGLFSPIWSYSHQSTGSLQYAKMTIPNALQASGRIGFVETNGTQSCYRSARLQSGVNNYETTFADLSVTDINFDLTSKNISWKNSGAVLPIGLDFVLSEIGKDKEIEWALTIKGTENSLSLPELPPDVVAQLDWQAPELVANAVHLPSYSYENLVSLKTNSEPSRLSSADRQLVSELNDQLTFCSYVLKK
ncbi:MAG: hypothetical protein U1F46_03145 [Marinagarivorans sp.]